MKGWSGGRKESKENLSRLVSAYNNKFKDPRNQRQYHNWYGNLSFSQFVEMIVDTREELCPTYSYCHYNNHWKPYIAKCGYCDFPFKIIAKKETFKQDQRFIGKLAGIQFSSMSMYEQ